MQWKERQSEKKLLCHNLGQKLCSKSQTYLSATYWIWIEESIFWLKVHSVFTLRSFFYYSHPLNDPLMACVKIHLHSINASLIFSSFGFMPVIYLSCISRGQRSTHLLAGLHLWMTNPAVCWRCWLLGEQCKGQALVPETLLHTNTQAVENILNAFDTPYELNSKCLCEVCSHEGRKKGTVGQ